MVFSSCFGPVLQILHAQHITRRFSHVKLDLTSYNNYLLCPYETHRFPSLVWYIPRYMGHFNHACHGCALKALNSHPHTHDSSERQYPRACEGEKSQDTEEIADPESAIQEDVQVSAIPQLPCSVSYTILQGTSQTPRTPSQARAQEVPAVSESLSLERRRQRKK